MIRGLLIAALSLWASLAQAQMGQIPSYVTPPAASGCSDSNATSWKNAVVTAGGTVSTGQQTNVCNLIVALKGHGLFAKLDRMWLYASENATQAKIDIVNLATHTVNGSPTFTASQGYTGTGATTDFINTNFNTSTSGVNFAATSASLGVYIRNNRTASANITDIGCIDSGGNNLSIQINVFGSQYVGGFPGVSTSASGATTTLGFWVETASSTASTLYHNSASVIATSGGGSGLASNNVSNYALASNDNGTTIQATTDQLAVVFYGANLSSTDDTNLSADVNGVYMTALGTNVY